MTFLKELNKDYKLTFEAWKDAKEDGDKEIMQRMAKDLVRIADAMERER